MRRARCLPTVVLSLALAAVPAGASVPHVVGKGETLWSIAAANGLTTRAFAAANGLPADAQVVLGSTLRIPSVTEAAAALRGLAPASGAGAGTAAAPSVAASAPAPMGAYTVRPGDTLSALAASSRVPVAQVAYMNGLDPDAPLLAGTLIKLPTGAPTPARAALPAPATQVPASPPYATPGRLTADQIAQVAGQHGVPASLAAAIAWQESGFNNAMVSPANARGVMQVVPGTWDWVQRNLATATMDPASPLDNVQAGVLYLGSLLKATGGDPGLAAAAYYQGLGSVQRIGMLPDTRRYVADVLALRSRFGGS
jgi:soluble lytic murein transglycosylase-like protein